MNNELKIFENPAFGSIRTTEDNGKVLFCGTDVAKELNIAQPTANQKINNVRPFDLDEAEALAKMLHIEVGDFGTYFFAD